MSDQILELDSAKNYQIQSSLTKIIHSQTHKQSIQQSPSTIEKIQKIKTLTKHHQTQSITQTKSTTLFLKKAARQVSIQDIIKAQKYYRNEASLINDKDIKAITSNNMNQTPNLMTLDSIENQDKTESIQNPSKRLLRAITYQTEIKENQRKHISIQKL